MRGYYSDNSDDEVSIGSFEWEERNENPPSPEERQRSREIENRRRKIRNDYKTT